MKIVPEKFDIIIKLAHIVSFPLLLIFCFLKKFFKRTLNIIWYIRLDLGPEKDISTKTSEIQNGKTMGKFLRSLNDLKRQEERKS